MSMDSFNQYRLPDEIKAALERIGFTQPTEIQQKSIPLLLEKRDLIGKAETGSGKTAAFFIPLLTRVLNENAQGLILVPTRELALQIEEFAKLLTGKTIKTQCVSIIGGGAMGPQIRALSQKPRIIVATPGRLMDHMQRGTVNLKDLSVLVLDEADRMLDMGFYPQIKRIGQRLPQNRQTILFSATFPNEVRKLANEFQRSPVEIFVGGTQSKASTSISQSVIEIAHAKKNDKLLDELNARQGSVLIFMRTRHRTDRLSKYLTDFGFKTGRIHGDRSLFQRRQAIDGFKKGDFRILVATDIAARGLDISSVAHVINFDLPQTQEDYIHRIGRTGRAGATGHALSFVAPEEARLWKMLTRDKASSQRERPVYGSSGGGENRPHKSAGGGGSRGGRRRRPFSRNGSSRGSSSQRSFR